MVPVLAPAAAAAAAEEEDGLGVASSPSRLTLFEGGVSDPDPVRSGPGMSIPPLTAECLLGSKATHQVACVEREITLR